MSTAKDESCRYCGGYHAGICPRIEEIEYYPGGGIKKVKLRPWVETAVDYKSQVNVTWHPLPETSQYA